MLVIRMRWNVLCLFLHSIKGVDLYTIKMHSSFISISMAMELPKGDLTLWVKLYV
jgi:hypothetical protein